MFKKSKIYFFILILIFLGFLFYSNRIVIKEYFTKSEQIELPEAVKFTDIQKDLGVQDLADENENNNEIDLSPNPDPETEIPENDSPSNLEFNVGVNPAPDFQSSDGMNLAVPFTIQSPDQKWEDPYDEGCEEASILMVYSFLKNKEISVDSALKDIGAMIDWQEENFKGHFDLSVNYTAQMAREFLDITAEVVFLNSIDDIKKIVKTGYPVILPTAGKKLGNPNFRGAGPLYHMLVVKGFTADGLIITNDPGTRKGENYVYDANVLWNAIGDWDEQLENPNQERKVGIVIK
jgi:hypothetical protein